MTIGEYARARVGETLRSWLGNWPMSEFPRVFGTGGATLTGVSVTEDSALTYSPFWSGVCIISADVASLPLVVYKVEANGNKLRYVDHSLYEILHDNPNPEMGSMVCRETMQAHALTYGNAYAEIERDAIGRPVAIWPITPDRVTPFRNSTKRMQYRVSNASGSQTVLNAADMLHVPGLSFDGFYGYEVVQRARESIALGLATERFGASFFGNGSTFGGVLSHPGKLTTEVKQGIRESLNALHTGVDRAHRFAIFGDGMKYDATGVPPNHAQFNETRKLQVEEAARWLRMPQHKLNGLDHATFSNIEHLDLEYYKSCLRGWLVRWEQEFNRKLIPRLERHRMFTKHIVEGFLRGDSAARSEYYTKMFNIGAYSINDILEREDMNPIGPEGDVHFVQGNLMPADILMKGPQQKELPPGPIVEALPPAPDEDDEDEDEQNRALLMAIAEKTTAIEAGLTAQRDALSQAELEQQQQAVTRLEEERTHLQQQFDEFRERHAADATALDQARQAADAVAFEEQVKRADAEAAAATAQAEREAALARVVDSEAAATQVRQVSEAMSVEAQARVEAAETRAAALVEEQRVKAEVASAATVESQAQAIAATLAQGEAERQRIEAEAALAVQRQAETERLTGMLAAHRALIVESMGRMVRRETDKARKHQATAEKLRDWAESFYIADEHVWLEALRPAVRVHLTWKQSSDDVDTVTVGLVRDHYTESMRQLRAVVDSDPEDMHVNLERMLSRWEQDRPNALADRILKEEVEYVRSYR